MTRVLVSGAEAAVTKVAEALRELGATATEVVQLSDLPAAVRAAGPDAFDSYVQLGASFTVEGSTAIQRVHHFFADGVLARFTALDTVLAALTRPARVTFVMGRLPPDVASSADRDARRALTEVLARAAQADMAPTGLRVEILEATVSALQIARSALDQGRPAFVSVPDLDELSFADWRVEFLGVAQLET